MADINPFALEGSSSHIRCSRECGFLVNENYIAAKTRFLPGICPRANCGAPLKVCDPYSFEERADRHIETDPSHRNYRRIVDGERPGRTATVPPPPAGVTP